MERLNKTKKDASCTEGAIPNLRGVLSPFEYRDVGIVTNYSRFGVSGTFYVKVLKVLHFLPLLKAHPVYTKSQYFDNIKPPMPYEQTGQFSRQWSKTEFSQM